MPLPKDVEAQYTTIIDAILATSDLNTISEKRIRKGLQAIVQHDLVPRKAEIKELIMARFDEFNSRQNSAPLSTEESPVGKVQKTKVKREAAEAVQQASPPTFDARHEEDDDDDMQDMSDVVKSEVKAPKRKIKHEPIDADARYAARLQAEEDSRVRATRGAPMRKNGVVRKRKRQMARKRSSKMIRGDASDVESGSEIEPKKEVKRTGAFHTPQALSAPLADFLGETMLPRPQVVKRIWAYVKEHDLQDPNDRRQIRCDDSLRTVFKQDRVHMFTMNKLLTAHVFAPGE